MDHWMRPTRSWLGVFLVTTLLTLGTNSPVGATLLTQHGYAAQQNSNANQGGYFSSDHVEQLSSSQVDGNCSFITKEEWINFPQAGGYNQWIEAGTMDGGWIAQLSGNTTHTCAQYSYWKGFFAAYQYYDATSSTWILNWYKVGSSNPQNTHNFEIQRTTGTDWKVYVDFSQVLDIPSNLNYTQANNHIVGIETTDTLNTFTTPSTGSALEYLDLNGVWQFWTAGATGNWDQNTLGWKSSMTFGQNSNTITITHP